MTETQAALREQLEHHEKRITELEIEAAFRRQAHEELDEVVQTQGQQIQRLERRLAELVGQLAVAADE